MFFRSFDGAPCVAGTFISQKAGLAQIKLVATLNISQAEGFPVDFPEVITLKHDFNVAWMNINQARLAENSTDDGCRRWCWQPVAGVGERVDPVARNYGELGLGDSVDDAERLGGAGERDGDVPGSARSDPGVPLGHP